jgi:hypothetical protein
MCLEFVEFCFSAPQWYPSATVAWNNTSDRHGERQMPPVSVPVWFSWVGDIGDGSGTLDWGHVVLWHAPSGRFLSSPLHWRDGRGQAWVGSLEEIEATLGATYVGWSSDINGLSVAAWSEDPAPVPVAPTPEPTPEVVTPVIPPKPENTEHKEIPVPTPEQAAAIIAKQNELVAGLKPADLGSIITNNKTRKIIWAIYGITGIFIVGIMGGLTAAQIIAPVWFIFATGSYTAVGPAFASLAIANISTKGK